MHVLIVSGGCESMPPMGAHRKAAEKRALSSVLPIESGYICMNCSRITGIMPRKEPA